MMHNLDPQLAPTDCQRRENIGRKGKIREKEIEKRKEKIKTEMHHQNRWFPARIMASILKVR